MFIRKFRLQNYRSFKDSGDVMLARAVTILAGQNASGKSALLEALSGLTLRTWTYPASAVPIQQSADPKLIVTYELSDGDLQRLTASFRSKPSDAFLDHLKRDGLTVTYTKSENLWQVNISELPDDYASERTNSFKELDELFALTDKSFADVFDSEGLTNSRGYDKLRAAIAAALEERPPDLATALQSRSNTIINGIVSHLPLNEYVRAIESFAPSIVTVGTLKLPDSLGTPFTSLSEDGAFSALSAAYGLDYEAYKAADPQRRRQMLGGISASLQSDIAQHWSQWPFEFRVEMDVDRVIYGVVEGANWYAGNQTSDGTRAFVQSLLQIRSAKQNSIVLVDEPGKELHINAQTDLLAVLHKLGSQHQIIYSTHSPYMIPVDALHAVRLVERTEVGSIVRNSAYDGGSAEGWKPVLDAIGLNLKLGVGPIRKSNVIFEGVSDYIYITAMARALGDLLGDLGLIPCFGGTHPRNVASILHGWGLDYAIVLDSDAAGARDKAKLIADPLFPRFRIISLPDDKHRAIEDLFTRADFDNHVLSPAAPDRKEGEANSALIGRLGRPSKALVAKQFAERLANGIGLDDETLESFRTVIAKIRDVFESTQKTSDGGA
jgi:predicted ATPase